MPNPRPQKKSLFKWTKGSKVAWCEAGTVRWMWQNHQHEVSNCLYLCGRTMGAENCSGAREHFWTAVFFCCELQISICLMFSTSATSDTVILLSSWVRTLARFFLICFVDRAPRHKFMLITNLMHFFMYLFINFISLHVSSIKCSSSGDRIVLIHHLVWLVCVSDCLVCR